MGYLAEAESDEQLLDRVVAGNKAALEQLYHRHKRLVYAIALRVLRAAPAAEEVTQDVFLKLWRQPERFDRSRGAFTSWLASVAQRQAIDQLRANRRRYAEPLPEHDYAEATSDPGPGTAEQAETAVLAAAVRLALAGLKAEQRRTLELAYFAGLSHQEIAEREGTPLGTVKGRLRLAFQHLRTALLHGGEGGTGA